MEDVHYLVDFSVFWGK